MIDADSGAVRATVPLGGEVGNVVYNPSTDRMVVAVQGRNDLAFVDPVSFAVTERIPTPGCDHPHGQALDVTDQVMFVGCEANATMVTVDLVNRNMIDHHEVGETPDVLAYDSTPSASTSLPKAAGSAFSIKTTATSRRGVRPFWPTGRTHWLSTPQRTTATFRSPRTTTDHRYSGVRTHLRCRATPR